MRIVVYRLWQRMQIVIRIHFLRSIVDDLGHGQHVGQGLEGTVRIQAHLIQQLLARWHRVHGDDSAFAHQPRMVLSKGFIVRRLTLAARFLVRLQLADAMQKLTNEG